MTFKDVSRLTGIPYQTLLGWDNSTGYRKNLARFLKESDEQMLQKKFNPVPSDMILSKGDLVLVRTDEGNYETKIYSPTETMRGEIIFIIEKAKKENK